MGRYGQVLVFAMAAGCPTGSGFHTPDAGIDAPPPTRAVLSMTPPTADLGTVFQGQNVMTSFTVSNTGESTSGFINAIATGPNAADFAVQSSCAALAAAGTCNVTVTFTASSPGARSANLVVSASPGGIVMVTLTAMAVSDPPLAISPPSFAFPDQLVNTTSTTSQIFTVTNASGFSTGVLTVTATGSDHTEFVNTADTCSGAALAASTSCSFAIGFHPTTIGGKAAAFAVIANPGGTVSAALSGTGQSATVVSITPSVQSFGAIDLCGSSANVTFTLTDTGNFATGPLAAPVLGGVNAAQFVIVSQTCTGVTLMPNSANSCDVVVRLDPASVGAFSATLSLTATPGGTATAALQGSGDAASGFYIAPTGTTNFGTVTVGSASASTTYTVTNVCRTATAALSTVLAGPNPGEFAISANTCQGAMLAPVTGSCTIAAAFTPHSTGAKSAALTVSNNAQPATAGLSGTGN